MSSDDDRPSGSRTCATRRPDRPWRKLGTAICGVLAMMYVLGVTCLDSRRTPELYLLYWFVMLMLIVWLLVLAFKDVRFTRRLVQEHRGRQSQA